RHRVSAARCATPPQALIRTIAICALSSGFRCLVSELLSSFRAKFAQMLRFAPPASWLLTCCLTALGGSKKCSARKSRQRLVHFAFPGNGASGPYARLQGLPEC